MAARGCVFLLVFLLGSRLAWERPAELIVWNVGQGQWVTILVDGVCWHLDMGGEFAPWQEIRALCRGRENRASLSHWDMDHIVFAPSARGHLPDLCLVNAPLGHASAHKESMILTLPRCIPPSPFVQWADPEGKTANQKSWVVSWRGILAAGDSPRDEEKKWIHHLPGLENTQYLILGHHGSRTSTSRELLGALPALRFAIASARRRRYGHPHPEVVAALALRHVPLLRTEEWGTIHIRLD